MNEESQTSLRADYSNGQLENSVAIVTGGASGIGQAIAELFAREGSHVVIADIQDDAGNGLAKKISAAGGKASFFHLDTTDESNWEEVINGVIRKHGRLDILINNAGIGGGTTLLHETTFADWRKVMAVNLDAVFLGCKHGIKAMSEKGRGSIVNVSSILGLVSMPRTGAYTTSKGGVRLLTKAAAVDCASIGTRIRVNSIHPGFTKTPQVDDRLASDDGANFNALVDATVPFGAWATPLEIAKGVLYFASDASEFVTGAELVIDGGVTASV